MLTPNQKNEIRARHERNVRVLNYGQLPPDKQMIQAIHDLGDMLNDDMNRTRP